MGIENIMRKEKKTQWHETNQNTKRFYEHRSIIGHACLNEWKDKHCSTVFKTQCHSSIKRKEWREKETSYWKSQNLISNPLNSNSNLVVSSVNQSIFMWIPVLSAQFNEWNERKVGDKREKETNGDFCHTQSNVISLECSCSFRTEWKRMQWWYYTECCDVKLRTCALKRIRQ